MRENQEGDDEDDFVVISVDDGETRLAVYSTSFAPNSRTKA